MSSIIDDFQMMAFCDFLNCIGIAEISIHMDRHDGTGPIGDQCLDLFRIHRVIICLDIAEYRPQAISDNCMSGGDECERSRDDFPFQMQ